MYSKVVVTNQIDDIEESVSELLEKLKDGFTFCKNTVGILFFYSDMDVSEFVKVLNKKAPFDIIGSSCIASLDSEEGFHEMSVTLIVLTADDCEFSLGVTGSLTPDNVVQEIERTYSQARDALSDEAKLVVAFPPYTFDIILDSFADGFNKAAAGVPVVGGIPSYNTDVKECASLAQGRLLTDKLCMLLITGNIKPVFTVSNIASSSPERKRRVTESDKNIILKVGDQTFVEYMEEMGISAQKFLSGDANVMYLSHPLLVENVNLGIDDKTTYVRALSGVDMERGAGITTGIIPEGVFVSVCTLTRSDINTMVLAGMKAIKETLNAKADAYRYSTMLAMSCTGRFLLMLPTGGDEADRILEELPGNIAMSGMYSSGELGPVPLKDGGFTNLAFNESLVLCAF